jgi:hypothetical protein
MAAPALPVLTARGTTGTTGHRNDTTIGQENGNHLTTLAADRQQEPSHSSHTTLHLQWQATTLAALALPMLKARGTTSTTSHRMTQPQPSKCCPSDNHSTEASLPQNGTLPLTQYPKHWEQHFNSAHITAATGSRHLTLAQGLHRTAQAQLPSLAAAKTYLEILDQRVELSTAGPPLLLASQQGANFPSAARATTTIGQLSAGCEFSTSRPPLLLGRVSWMRISCQQAATPEVRISPHGAATPKVRISHKQAATPTHTASKVRIFHKQTATPTAAQHQQGANFPRADRHSYSME